MPRVFAHVPTLRPVMVFIDGGYLREDLKKRYGKEKDEFTIESFGSLLGHKLLPSVSRSERIRTYYYDAIIEESTIEKVKDREERKELREKREKQKAFFRPFYDLPFCDVRLGRLVYSKKEGLRQKGVDIKMAIDMLTKAYDGHYEFAILVAGDGDFADLVEAVKDAGRRVIGAYYKDNVSPELQKSFDYRIILNKGDLKPV